MTLGYEAFPEGVNRPAEAIGVTFSPKTSPGVTSCDQAPECSSCCSLKTRRLAIADRPVNLVAHLGSVKFVVGDPQAVGADLDAVKTRQSLTHGGVTALTNVVDQLADVGSERRVEDVAEPAIEDSRVLLPTNG